MMYLSVLIPPSLACSKLEMNEWEESSKEQARTHSWKSQENSPLPQ